MAVVSTFSGDSGDFEQPLFIAPPTTSGMYKVESASISFDTAVNDDASHRWEIKLEVGTASSFEDLSTAALSSATDFAANTAYTLDADGPEASTPKKVFLAAGDLVRCKFDETGTADDLSNVDITVTLFLRHSPPGR
jgi:hypothetical protein